MDAWQAPWQGASRLYKRIPEETSARQYSFHLQSLKLVLSCLLSVLGSIAWLATQDPADQMFASGVWVKVTCIDTKKVAGREFHQAFPSAIPDGANPWLRVVFSLIIQQDLRLPHGKKYPDCCTGNGHEEPDVI